MCDIYIQQVREGDSEAFRFVIAQFKDRAYSLAVSVVKDEMIAQDVVQNAFVKAYTKLDTFEGKSKFSSWLYRIVINEALTEQRKENRNPEVRSEESVPIESPDLNRTFLKMEEEYQRYYINETLSRLSAKYSLALRLFYLEEFSIDEITEITGWSDSNTKVILHRARNKMQNVFSELFNMDKNELFNG